MMVVFILLALPTITEIFSSAQATPADQILFMQRIISIILVALLLTFLVFRLGTHAVMFASTPFSPRDQPQGGREARHSQVLDAQIPRPYIGKALGAFALAAASASALTCTYYIVSSLSGLAAIVGTNQAFLAVTLIPLFGNAFKYYSIIVKSRSYHQVELGIRSVINNVLRVTMLVAPLLVLLGWGFDEPLTLRFDPFEATTLLLSVVIMTYLISDGRSNYFEGLMLIGT
jgi:Ca2+:H+ antiporter